MRLRTPKQQQHDVMRFWAVGSVWTIVAALMWNSFWLGSCILLLGIPLAIWEMRQLLPLGWVSPHRVQQLWEHEKEFPTFPISGEDVFYYYES